MPCLRRKKNKLDARIALETTTRKVTNKKERLTLLHKYSRYFKCIRKGHLVRDCKSQIKCSACGGAHHLPICDKTTVEREKNGNSRVAAKGLRETSEGLGIKRLSKELNVLKECDKLIREQLNSSVIEEVAGLERKECVHYLPHQAVIRRDAKTTKLRVG